MVPLLQRNLRLTAVHTDNSARLRKQLKSGTHNRLTCLPLDLKSRHISGSTSLAQPLDLSASTLNVRKSPDTFALPPTRKERKACPHFS